jgi:hypothetical protein
MATFQVKTPLSAVWHKPGGQKESVTLPVGALIEEASRHSATLEGKVGVYWEGRHYSVSLKDLLTKADPTHG